MRTITLPNTLFLTIILLSVHADRICGLLVKSSWLQIQRSTVRFPELPNFLGSSASGTGSTQPRDDRLRSYLNGKIAAPGLENRD
jgi:hypothetical protein